LCSVCSVAVAGSMSITHTGSFTAVVLIAVIAQVAVVLVVGISLVAAVLVIVISLVGEFWLAHTSKDD